MKDLLLHELDNFVLPNTATENEAAQIMQSYLSQLLTFLGSIDVDPEVGCNIEVGKQNIVDFRFELIDANYHILPYLTSDYGVTSITIDSVVQQSDQVFAQLSIFKGTTVIPVAIAI